MKVVARGATRPWPEDWGTSKRLIAVGEEDQSVLVEGQWR